MNAFNKTLVGLAAIVLACGTAAAQQKKKELPAEVKTQDYTLKVETIAAGLRFPWSIAFIDASHALITEKGGKLRLWENGKLLPDPVKNIPIVNSDGQGGLMDVAVDPDYDKNGWIYFSYSHSQSDKTNGAAMTRLVRGKIRDGAWTDQQVLFEAKPNHYRNNPNHHGSRIVFDHAGHLFFSIGERGNAVDAQDITKPNGKIHRINLDGSIPKDNPFFGKPNVYASIYSYGHRNPQGLAFDLETGALWETEHGPMGGDELNLSRPGLNFGWPVITWGINYDGKKIGDGITEKEGMEQPAKYWVPSPAICGLDILTGDLLPKWKGNLLVGALKFQEVKRVVMKDKQYVSEEVILKNPGRVRDVVVGPEGAIYVVLNNPDLVIRLSPVQ